MLNLISCELLKLKRSKMVLISVAGVLSTPLLMLISEFLHWCWTKFKKHREKKRQEAKQPEE